MIFLKLIRFEDIHEIQNLQGRYNHSLSMGVLTGCWKCLPIANKDPNIELEVADSGVYVVPEGIMRWLVESIEPKHI